MAVDVSDVTVELGVAVVDDETEGAATPTVGFTSAGLGMSVLGTDSDELVVVGFEPSLLLSNPILREENPKDSYNSLTLRSRDFNTAKALMVPDALKHAIANMVNLLVTD